MRAGRVAGILILMTALAAPAPPPTAEALARAVLEQGATFVQSGRYSEAVDELSHAIATRALSPADTARALFDRGVAQDGLGNMRAAISDYTAALSFDAELAPALNNRGNALRRTGQFAEAKHDYLAALNCPGVTPEYPYYGLGLIALQQGDGQLARGYFGKALAANPSYLPAAQGLSDLAARSIEAQSISKTSTGLRRLADDNPAIAEAPVEKRMPRMKSARPVSQGKDALVQVGAFQTAAMALDAWDKIAAVSGDALQGLTPFTATVDVPGKGRLWRLRTAVSDPPAAKKLCQTLAQHRQACLLPRD